MPGRGAAREGLEVSRPGAFNPTCQAGRGPWGGGEAGWGPAPGIFLWHRAPNPKAPGSLRKSKARATQGCLCAAHSGHTERPGSRGGRLKGAGPGPS